MKTIVVLFASLALAQYSWALTTPGPTGTAAPPPGPAPAPGRPSVPSQAQKDAAAAILTGGTANISSADLGSVLNNDPAALSSSDIANLPPAAFLANLATFGSKLDNFQNPTQKAALGKKVVAALGNPSSWTAASLGDAASVVTLLKPAELDAIPTAAFTPSVVTSLASSGGSSKDLKRQLKAKVTSAFGAASAWDEAKVVAGIAFIAQDPTQVSNLDPNVAANALKNMTEKLDKADAALLFAKIRSSSAFSKGASSMTNDDVAQLSSVISAAPPTFIASLPPAAVAANLANLKDVTFDKSAGREIAKAAISGLVSGNVSSLTGAQLQSMGSLIKHVSVDDLANFPAAALTSVVSTLAEENLDLSAGMTILGKLGSLSSIAKNLGKLMDSVSVKSLESITAADLGYTDASHTVTANPDSAKAQKHVEKIVAELGSITAANAASYDLAAFTRWAAICKGVVSNQVSGMSNTQLGDWLSVTNAGAYEIPPSVEDAIKAKVKTYLGIGATVSTDTTVAKNAAKYAIGLTAAELGTLGAPMKAAIIQYAGTYTYPTTMYSTIESFADFALSAVDRTGDGTTVVDRRNEASLDETDLSNMGSMICGLSEAALGKLTTTAINDYMSTFAECTWPNAKAAALVARAKTAFTTATLLADTTLLSKMGPLLVHFSSADLAAISDANLASIFPGAFTTIQAADAKYTKAADYGITIKSSTGMTEYNTLKAAFVTRGLAALSATSSRRRRRRAVATVTASQISSLGTAGVVGLTAEQIATISDSDFKDSIDTLGAPTTWSAGQLSALATKAKSAYTSTLTSWTASDIASLKNILAGLTTTELQTLVFGDCTAAGAGADDVFTAEQAAAIWTSIKTNMLSNNVATNADSVKLTCMGTFVAGAPTGDISSITPANYAGAAEAIGKATKFDTAQQEAWFALAKDAAAFGAPSGWTGSNVGTVGSLVGGMSNAELSALTEAQIQGMTNIGVSTIPGSKISALSAAQLGYLSASQLSSFTSSQQAYMSAEQRAVLTANGVTIQSGSARVNFSVGMFFACLMVAVARFF